MRLLPFEECWADSPLPAEELRQSLIARLDAGRASPATRFDWREDANGLVLWPLSGTNMDGLWPIASCTMEPRPEGSRLRASIRLRWLALVFMALWITLPLSGFVLGAAAGSASAFAAGTSWREYGLFSLTGYLGCMGFFWWGSARIKRILLAAERG